MLRSSSRDRNSLAPRASKRKFRTLLSSEQLDQAMLRECTRVDRKTSGPLSMVLFRLPNRRDHRNVIRLALTILKRIRVNDDLGWFDKHHLGLLLPETPGAGAWQLAQEVCHIVAQRGAAPQCIMYTYAAQGAQEEKDSVRSEPLAIKVAS